MPQIIEKPENDDDSDSPDKSKKLSNSDISTPRARSKKASLIDEKSPKIKTKSSTNLKETFFDIYNTSQLKRDTDNSSVNKSNRESQAVTKKSDVTAFFGPMSRNADTSPGKLGSIETF